MGTITTIIEPTAEPVTIAELSQALRVDQSDDDARLAMLISVSRRWVEQFTGYYLMPQVVELSLQSFPNAIFQLGVWPIISVDSVKYDDTGSPQTEQTLTEGSDYLIDLVTLNGQLCAVNGWPAVAAKFNPVRIRMTVGHALAGSPEVSTVPDFFREALMAYAGYLYDDESSMKDLAEQILIPYRMLS